MAKKRGNNEGSIHKRKNGTWRAQISLNGRRVGHTAKTKELAQVWLRKIQDEVDEGLRYDSSQITLEKFMMDWLVTVEPSLRKSTNVQYRQLSETYIIPRFGMSKLRELRPEQIQGLYNQMLKAGKGLRTIRLTHSVLHRALVYAVKLGILPRNPAKAALPPKLPHKEKQTLDEVQVQRLLLTAKVNGDRFYALYHLAISTGMRQGELLGLKWADVELEHGSLHIQRQYTQYGFSTPKTKSGIRHIDLGVNTARVLRDHLQGQYQEMVSAGPKWEDNDLVFPSSRGTPMNRNNLRRMWLSLLEQADVPRIRFHDLRHTAASLMLNNGVPVIVVSKRLGHAHPSITLDVYGHLVPSGQKQAAVLMDKLLTPVQVELS